MEELKIYKKALKMACSDLVLAQSNLFNDIKIFATGTNEYTDEYYTDLVNKQRQYVHMAEVILEAKQKEDTRHERKVLGSFLIDKFAEQIIEDAVEEVARNERKKIERCLPKCHNPGYRCIASKDECFKCMYDAFDRIEEMLNE